MTKSVVLNLGSGDLNNGFPRVTAQIRSAGYPFPEQFIGSLPSAPELVELYRHWQSIYHSLCDRKQLRSLLQLEDDELEIDAVGITNISQLDFDTVCQNLQEAVNAWLKSREFLNIERQLRSQLNPTEEIRVILETHDELLRRLPWHRWDFFQDYSKAEIALSSPEYKHRKPLQAKTPKKKVRILAVLGNSQGINLTTETKFLKNLRNAEIQFLIKPSRQELNTQLWNSSGWDILFFAGHSQTEGETGRIYINENETNNSLTIEQLDEALKQAIEKGLKLAIFNSCDGLRLANALEKLNIPTVIVMREPVPNHVAQEFFKHFLDAFAVEQLPLYLAIRQARRRLQGLEDKFPGASWLPVICQNPAVEPPTWQQLHNADEKPFSPQLRKWPTLRTVVTASLTVSCLLFGLRWQGKLQTWELQAYDHLMQQQPVPVLDNRLLIVRITKEDIREQPLETIQGGASSLSDAKLDALLKKLQKYQPRVIGLDIYRGNPVNPRYPDLKANLEKNKSLIAVCESDSSGNLAPPEVTSERISFSDFVPDEDDVIRRHLLLMPTSYPCPKKTEMEAFSLKLALSYLKKQGITRHDSSHDKFLKIGSVVFKPLEIHTGGYHRTDLDRDGKRITDMGGHQVMLNYLPYQNYLTDIAPSVTLKEVLSNQFNPDYIRDKIILIGVDSSDKDQHLTPYSNKYQPAKKIPGVFVHAQMVSQILRIVMGERPLFWAWAWWGDALWVSGWSLIGGILTWQFKLLRYLGLAYGIALSILYGLCLTFLMQGGWIPLIPSALALLITGVSIRAYVILRY